MRPQPHLVPVTPAARRRSSAAVIGSVRRIARHEDSGCDGDSVRGAREIRARRREGRQGSHNGEGAHLQEVEGGEVRVEVARAESRPHVVEFIAKSASSFKFRDRQLQAHTSKK